MLFRSKLKKKVEGADYNRLSLYVDMDLARDEAAHKLGRFKTAASLEKGWPEMYARASELGLLVQTDTSEINAKLGLGGGE